MPIQFRCTTCNQLLSISRKKAGVEILCPKCTTLTRVPQVEEATDEPPVAAPVKPKPASAPAAPKSPPVIEQKPVERPPVAPVRPSVFETRPVQAVPPPPPPKVDRPAVDDFDEGDAFEDGGGFDAADGLLSSEGGNDVSEFLHASHGGLVSTVPGVPYNPWTDIDHDDHEFHPTKRQHPPKDELDMTSLVDVTFLLLVFFMITASFTVQKFMQVAAPESDDSKAAAATVVSNDDIVGESVIIAIDAQDRILVDDAPVSSMSELRALLTTKLTDKDPKTDVLIEAAYQATHGTVVAVTDNALQSGMRHVRRASRRDAD